MTTIFPSSVTISWKSTECLSIKQLRDTNVTSVFCTELPSFWEKNLILDGDDESSTVQYETHRHHGIRYDLKSENKRLSLEASKFPISDPLGVTHADMINRSLDTLLLHILSTIVGQKQTAFLSEEVPRMETSDDLVIGKIKLWRRSTDTRPIALSSLASRMSELWGIHQAYDPGCLLTYVKKYLYNGTSRSTSYLKLMTSLLWGTS